MLMEMMNTPIQKKESFVPAKLGTIAWEIVSQMVLRKCSREALFSGPFYILSEQRTSKVIGAYSFKILKKTDWHMHSRALAPWKEN